MDELAIYRGIYTTEEELNKILEIIQDLSLIHISSVQDKELPPTSLLREFLGGSSFRY